MGDLADREVSNAKPAIENLTAREVADAIWLASRWHLRGEAVASAAPLVERDDTVLPPQQQLPGPPSEDSPKPLPEPDGHDSEFVLRAVSRTTEPTGHRQLGFDKPPTPMPAVPLRGLHGALRPLRRTLPSVRDRILDEEATAKHALVDPRWIPVFKPADELRWDVVLVVDDSPSMRLWRNTVRAVAELLVRQGAFQNVRVQLLTLDMKRGCSVRGTAPGAPRHDISEVLAPTGRRILVVLTDSVSDGWRSGIGQSVLGRWARSLPVVIVHLLPWPMWRNTGLRVHRLAFQASIPGVANRNLFWRPQAAAAKPLYEDLGNLTPVPVLELDARWLRPWARLVAGNPPGWTKLPAILLDASPGIELAAVDDAPGEAARRVAEFRAMADPVTFDLATYLAAAPLDLDVMRAVQKAVLPSSNLTHLSEFLACGPVDQIEPVNHGSIQVNYRFEPGARAELLAAGRRFGTAHVMQVVERCVPEARGFGLLLNDDSTEADASAVTLGEPLLGIRATALAAMSANHFAASRRLLQLVTIDGSDGTDQVAPRGPRRIDQGSSVDYYPVAASGGSLGRLRAHRPTRDRGGAEVSAITDPEMEETRIRPTMAHTVWGGVPPRNPMFTGREDLLGQLHERLEPGAMTAVLPQALHGLGGVGKSQLAVEYAYRHREDFDIIWWVPAELTVQIQNSLTELGERLELGVPNEANIAVGVVLDALKGSVRGGRHIPSNWLLVFDNAEDPKNVLPYLPTGGSGRILVTSRNSQWLNLASPLEVDVFQRQESIELLQRRGPDLNDDDADRLAAALGDLPLAIEVAAAWRAETGMPADEYIQLLRDKQIEMLDLPGPPDYQKSVAAAWNLSLTKLETSNPAALRLLQVCAFFAPEPIPRAMFANARGVSVVEELDQALHDRLKLNAAIRDINRYALARIDHRVNSIQMHRLVQAVLVSQMDEDEQATMRHGTHLLLAANDPFTPAGNEQWPKYNELYPHVVASNAIECEDSAVRELVYNMAQFLYYWGDHRASREMSQQIYDIWHRRLGESHVDTLKIGRWLGFMLWINGEFQRAAEFDAALLDLHQSTLDEDHEDTLDAINSVAGDRRAQGDFSGALELSRTILQRDVERFGDNDPLALNAAHNLGVSLRLSGRFAEALERDEQTYQRKVETYGTDHADSLITQVGLTIDQRELGEYVAASTTHEDIVGRYRLIHGPLNPATLRAILHQAGMRRKAGDHTGATAAADEAYEGLSRRYGPDHPDTIAAVLSRSINLRQAGDIEGARRLGEDVLERYRRTLGDDHPHTLSASTVLAVSCRLLNELDRAQELDQSALDGFRARLGDDHPSTIVAAVNLASDRFALGDIQGAYDLDIATSDVAQALLGPDHPTTLACRSNLARDLRALGQDEEGDALRSKVIVEAIARLGNAHPAISSFTELDKRADCDIDPMPL